MMTTEDQIKDEKLQYNSNRETAKTSPLSSGKIEKYEYLTGEERLPSNRQQIIQHAKFTYSPLGKAFKKQTKTIEDQGEKQVDALKFLESFDKQLPSVKDVISKEQLNPEIIDEIKRIGEEERKVDRSKMVYKGHSKTYDFRKFKAIRVFENKIRKNILDISMANDEQNHLPKYITEFNSKTKPLILKENVLNSAMALLKGREMVFKAFESGILLKSQKLKHSEQPNKSSDSDISLFTPKNRT